MMKSRKRLSVFEKILLFIHVILALFLLIGVLAGSTNPDNNIWIAFIGLAFTYVLIFNILFLIWWLLSRRWYLVIATIFTLAIAYKPINNTYQLTGKEGKSEKIDQNYIRLLTYNVHEFKKYGESNNISTKEQIIDLIKSQSPDIICFQEFYSRSKGEFNFFKSIKKDIGLQYHYFIPYNENDYESIGHAIFSRYPIKNTKQINFPGERANKSIYADLEVKDKTIRIYNVHFQSISFDKQDYDYIENLKNMDPKLKPTKRILRMLKTAFYKRGDQAELIKEELNKCPYPFVIAGDFNDTPASYTVNTISNGLKNAFREVGSGFGKTYNGKFPNFQIDYIMTSKNFDIHNYKIINKKLSDHFPIRSDLSLER